jgi:type IV pilus assembly protein PilC
MAHFTYTAQRADGEVYRGVVDARDRFEFYAIVRREGGKLMSVEEQAAQPLLTMRYWNTLLAHISEYDRILFARNLGAMLSAGLSLSRALAVMGRQTRNLKLQDIVASIEGSVRRGDTFNTALAAHPKVFSPLFIAMVRAGEESGDLPTSLTLVADQMERMSTIKKKVRGAMMYPSIVIAAMIGIGVLMMIYVVPTLASTFEQMHSDLPTATKAIIGLSDFLVSNALLAAILALSAGVGFYAFARSKPGGRTLDFVFLHLPVIGTLVREVNAARTARTMSSLLSAGVDVLGSLEITGQVLQNTYFKEVIVEAQKSVGQGEPLSNAFGKHEDLYPPFVGEMMSVGEETGATPEMLKRLAAYYENEVDSKTKDMSTIIEPILMLIIGGGVGFFAMAMITPIYSISQNV